MKQTKGKLIILSGPSGSGKKTVWSGILDNTKKYHTGFSVSMTTRSKRDGEIEGKDYFFVTKKQFEASITDKQLLEYATYANNYYGTPKQYVFNLLDKGTNVFLEIEMQGVLQILKNFPKDYKIVTIFIAPPSIEILRSRLEHRGTETFEAIQNRLKQAEWELVMQKHFQYVIVNDDLTKAKKQLESILQKEILANE